MILDRTAPLGLILVAGLSLAFSHPGSARPLTPKQEQEDQAKPKVIVPGAGGGSVQEIDEDYNRQLLQLERQRLERLSRLAAQQPPKDAEATYELLFRVAISNNLFREAEPAAQQVIKRGTSAPLVSFLAHTVDIIASADLGNFDESLAELRRVIESPVRAKPARPGARSPAIDTRAAPDDLRGVLPAASAGRPIRYRQERLSIVAEPG